MLRIFAIFLFVPLIAVIACKLIFHLIYTVCRKLSEPTPSLDDRAEDATPEPQKLKQKK